MVTIISLFLNVKFNYSFLFQLQRLGCQGKDVEFDGVSDLPSDAESMNTADKPSLDRQGSIQVKPTSF